MSGCVLIVVMVKKRTKAKRVVRPKQPNELDSVYLLKMVMYVIVGSLWLRVTRGSTEVPVPIGFLAGLLFSRHEHFQIDRKIEYAVLLVSMFIGFWTLSGVSIIFS